MKGVRFYKDYGTAPRKRKGQITGNVIAVHVQPVRGIHFIGITREVKDSSTKVPKYRFFIECISAIFETKNSPVASGSVAQDYLAKCCKFISAGEAREIHPALFSYLDLWGEGVGFEEVTDDVPVKG